MPKNILYAQSGGVTAVINASACGVIQTARRHPERFGRIFAARDGVLGVLHEEIMDVDQESEETIEALRHTPGGAFGSCRFDLGDPDTHPEQYERLVEVFRAHDIGYFFYNGGGGSMDTALKIAGIGDRMGYPITCIGVPKTIDNDLTCTDTSPGFGSAAKFIATVVREASLDVASMASSSTKVFIMEVMGRHAGWLAAAAALAQEDPAHPPMLILFAEIPFVPEHFFERLEATIREHGYCIVVASEGLKNPAGKLISIAEDNDVYAYIQLGGVAPTLARMIKDRTSHKIHWAVADYIQRSARHIAARVDVEQAYATGQKAVELAMEGRHSVMPTILRVAEDPYRWETGWVDLARVANIEQGMPRHFITQDGFHITEACRRYLRPLIEGEDYPPYEHGLPRYAHLKKVLLPKKLPPFEIRR